MNYTANLLISEAKAWTKAHQGHAERISFKVKDTAFKSRPTRQISVCQIYDLWVTNVSAATSNKLIERFNLRDDDADEKLSRYVAV